MALLIYHTFAFFILFSYGLYHLILSTRSFFKPQNPPNSSNSSYVARPYHPLPLPPHRHHLLRHLPLYLAIASLLLSISHYLILSLSSSSSALQFSFLHTSLSLSLFLLIALSLLLPFPPLPHDLTFLLSSLAFALLSSSSSPSPPSDLQSISHSISSTISAASSLFSLALAVFPKLYIFDLALSCSLCLQGLWSLQTGLTLYVEKFIPEGCHRLLDVADPSTRCDLEDSRVRAGQMLDLAFAMHATFVAVVGVVVYVTVAKVCGGGGGGLGRRYNGGSYEALPTSSSTGALGDLDHVQMKAMGKSSAQA